MSRSKLVSVLGGLLASLASSFCLAGILVVAPHPDDDLLIASGVIANAVSRGDSVKVVFMTNGDTASNAEGLVRQGEAVDAQTQHLGTTEDDLLFLGYPDGSLSRIFTDYPNVTDQYTTYRGQSVTYGVRGLGRKDYHSHKFGAPAAYNRANILADLESIIDTYRPQHILTTADLDQHPDHSTTYELIRLAASAVKAAHPEYSPVIYKTIVWAHGIEQSPVWPEPANPSTYHIVPPDLPSSAPAWSHREDIDVPLSMQAANLSTNPKYRAIQSHVSQGGAQSFIGRFIHKGEFFWSESLLGSAAPPRVDAGNDQSAVAGASVQLNGLGSSNPSGGSLSYHWRQIGGTTVALSNANVGSPTFIAPAGLTQDEVLSFELVVSSGLQSSLPDLVTVAVAADLSTISNVASRATVTASSENAGDRQFAINAIDGVADGYPGDSTREWATRAERAGAWIQLNWSSPVSVDKIVLFDRPNLDDAITGGTITFSDGSSLQIPALNNAGAATEMRFAARTITSLRLTITAVSASTYSIGLAEFQVFRAIPGGSNLPPLANAGMDQIVAPGATVHLDGSGSHDPEASSLTYHWRQIAGNTVVLSGENGAHPSFIAPSGLAQNALLSFELVVNDGSQNSEPTVVNVTVTAPTQQPSANVAPQASISASSENIWDGQSAAKAVDGFIDGYPGNYQREWATRNERVGAWIQLQWTAPVNIDRVVLFDRPNENDHITGGILTFSDGSSVQVPALDNAGGATTVTFTARTVASVRFTVSSVGVNTGNVGLSELQVFSVSQEPPANLAPIAVAGANRVVAQGVAVHLDGSASHDPESAPLSYQWRQVGGPSVALSGAGSATPSFTTPTGLAQNTVLSFELVVNDGDRNSLPSIVDITVFATQTSINLAAQASVTASSENIWDGQQAIKAVDGVADGYPGDYQREWATRGERAGAWIELRWSVPVVIERVILNDRPNPNDQITGGILTFSDGSTVVVPILDNGGFNTVINFSPKAVTSLRFTVTSVSLTTNNVGLSEIQAVGAVAH